MNSSSLCLASMTPSSVLRALEVKDNLRLAMTRKTPSHELRALDAIHRLGLSMT